MSVLHYFIHFLVFLNLFIIFPIIKNIKAQEIKRNVIREFPDKPIQLVKPDAEHKRLVIVEENVKVFVIFVFKLIIIVFSFSFFIKYLVQLLL